MHPEAKPRAGPPPADAPAPARGSRRGTDIQSCRCVISPWTAVAHRVALAVGTTRLADEPARRPGRASRPSGRRGGRSPRPRAPARSGRRTGRRRSGPGRAPPGRRRSGHRQASASRRTGSPAASSDRPELVDQPGHRHGQQGLGQPLLAAEVVVERRLGDAGGLDDLPDRGRVVSPVREEPGRDPEDRAAPTRCRRPPCRSPASIVATGRRPPRPLYRTVGSIVEAADDRQGRSRARSAGGVGAVGSDSLGRRAATAADPRRSPAMNRTTIRPNLDIADQPTAEELAALKAEGYTAVVNLRTAGEPDQPLDPTAEGEVVREAGLEYLHVPIGGPSPAGRRAGRRPSPSSSAATPTARSCCTASSAAGPRRWPCCTWPGPRAGRPSEAIERGREAGLTLPPKLAEQGRSLSRTGEPVGLPEPVHADPSRPARPPARRLDGRPEPRPGTGPPRGTARRARLGPAGEPRAGRTAPEPLRAGRGPGRGDHPPGGPRPASPTTRSCTT